MKRQYGKKTIGILNKGKKTTVEGCEFHGLDVGIDDKGEETIISGNKFFGKIKDAGFWKKYFWIPLLVVIIGGLIVNYLTN